MNTPLFDRSQNHHPLAVNICSLQIIHVVCGSCIPTFATSYLLQCATLNIFFFKELLTCLFIIEIKIIYLLFISTTVYLKNT